MSSSAEVRARALVGTRFRPQGHDPATGLDCIGLAAAAFRIEVPRRDYRLRGEHGPEIEHQLMQWFRGIPPRQCRAGDLLLMRVSADQLHMAVSSRLGFIHADAGIGRVVETPGPPPWTIAGVFRRRRRSGDQ